MLREELEALFKKYDDEYLKFDRIENKLSRRADLHAFLLLDSLVPETCDIISAAEHDTFYLSVEVDDLVKSDVTEEQVRDLVRCGVIYDESYDSLRMLT